MRTVAGSDDSINRARYETGKRVDDYGSSRVWIKIGRWSGTSSRVGLLYPTRLDWNLHKLPEH
jgi:hypothetical protein